MRFSYSAVWEDTVRLLRANGPLIAAVAGVFIFLPMLLLAYYAPQPQAATLADFAPAVAAYLGANWLWILLQGLVRMVGGLAILLLIFARPGTSVGEAIAQALALLPFYFLLSILAGLIVGFGFLLLIVPGLYLFGRLAVAAPVLVAERLRNPVEAIGRSFELTKGRGWAVFGLLLVVAAAGGLLAGVVNMLLSILFLLVAGEGLGTFLSLIVSAATGAAFAALFVTLSAALYRALAGGGSAAAAGAS